MSTLNLDLTWQNMAVSERKRLLLQTQKALESELSNHTTLPGWDKDLSLQYGDREDFGSLPKWLQAALAVIIE